MLSDWLWLLAFGAMLVAVQSLPAGLSTSSGSSSSADETKKTEQTMRPKVKRAQEMLMFGNQQNRQQATAESNNAANNYSPPAEKRTLSNSGLDDVSSALSDVEQQQQQQQAAIMANSNNHPKALPSGYMMDQPVMPQHEKSYEYGKVLVNEIGDVMPRGAWELVPPYGRYYGLSAEDRRKRSEESSSSSSTASPAAALVSSQQQTASVSSATQPKRSIPSYYQEPRYKRELDLDPEDLITFLTLYDNERRNRQNWRNYGNEEYEGADDDSNMIGLDDEDPRGSSWLDSQQYGQPQQAQQHHYLSGEPLLSSELAALARNRPSASSGYYDQYLGQQYGTAGQQYETAPQVQYGTPQYGLPYLQQHASYYSPEKRFMVARKRSQNYDSYGGRSGLLLNSRGYPSYQHRLLY
ncbi:prohormone-2 isoform X1 [Nasonia vitripennis]|uniref:Prohormone-2 n=1 Tax=Nasonia vitripennis TaxID=7425 RepID=A0A7M7QK75_NASVI|nr:prohormone-2 isoform X1 [Nasonia vitripennis]